MSDEMMETEVMQETIALNDINEIWPDLSNDLGKLRVDISEYGYNTLYSRYFVNKLGRLYNCISETMCAQLLTSLLSFNKPQNAYITMTIIKCSILLRPRFSDEEIFDRLRVVLIKKIDDYMKYFETQSLQEKYRVRFRGLRTILRQSKIELSEF
ncbi:MAG: hypothetical protein WD512_19930 [Candidatus Paceibacterota bacterium]